MVKTATVTLDVPYKDGETEVKSLMIRKPAPGELRGLSMAQLLNGDVDSHLKLIPRVTTPLITEAELTAGKLDTSDFSAVINELIDFLLPPSVRASL